MRAEDASTPRGTATRRERRKPRLCIGCSGWNYASWRARFYPADLPPSRWLQYYSTRLDTVEINNSFYRLPEKKTFAAWRRQTGGRFLFAVKASRFLTHMKRLRDPEEPLARLFSRAAGLGDKLGPVLYQLPGHFPIDLERLRRFLRALPQRVQHVMEFRHPSWYVPDTFECLERHNVTLCLHDKRDSAIAEPFVGPFTYLRFHGTSGHYHGGYADVDLAAWAKRLATQWRRGRDVYVYFNNDPDAEAPRNARVLSAFLDRLLRRRARGAV